MENADAVLWRVEREGVATSYLFGTVHVAHETLAELNPAVLEAVASSRIVALEAAEMSRSAFVQAMAEAGKLMSAQDKPLQRMLGDDELKVVEKALSVAGYPADLALGVRPWVATLFLASSECQERQHEAGLKPLDMLVSEAAKARSLPIVGLESMLEQFEALAAIPDEEQAAWLRASIEAHDRLDDVTHTMVELYHARQLAAVWELTRELAPRAKLSDDTLKRIREGLVDKRNRRMMAMSLPLVEKGGAFIAVGAMHLLVVGNFQDMGWHPDIAKTDAAPGHEPEVTTRTLTFKSGAVFTDKLTRYEPEARTIAFLTDKEDLKTLPVEGYSTTLTVTDAVGKAKVEWKGAFYRGYMNNDPPPELSDDAAVKAVTAFQKAGLEALKKKLEGGS
ncbi:MAG: TraB/GumN family protein [Hyphomicrobium sp.]